MLGLRSSFGSLGTFCLALCTQSCLPEQGRALLHHSQVGGQRSPSPGACLGLVAHLDLLARRCCLLHWQLCSELCAHVLGRALDLPALP